MVYYGMERYDKAEQYYTQAEQSLVKSLGADHPNIASININLGEIAWRRGQLAEAETRLRRALEILAQRVQPNHPSVATAEYDLANVLRDAGRPAEAEVLRDYAKLLQTLGRNEEAARLEVRADSIRG